MKFAAAVAVTAFAAVVAASGPAAGCLQTYTIKDGDGCEGIAASFSLTPDAFYAMNPGLHHAGDHLCDNLDTGKPYCVCMSKPCAQEKAVAAPSSVVASVATAALSTAKAAASSATKGASSAAAPMSTMALPSGSVAANASASASGSAAGASTTTAQSAGDKVIASVAMVALLAGAASVLAL
ncbi:unnamed protein product [Umbelopsis ramanniana]